MYLGTRSVLRRQSTTVGCLLSSRRHADAESRITSTAMRWLPRSHLGGDKFADGPTQDLHSMRAERRGSRADAALAAVCSRQNGCPPVERTSGFAMSGFDES